MASNTDAAAFRIRELELRHRVHRLVTPLEDHLEDARAVMTLAEDMLCTAVNDAVIVLHLTRHLKLLGVHRPSSLPDTKVIVAEILQAALLSNAAALIYVHRRISDDWASDDDGPLVQQLRQAARLLDVQLRDAIIIWSTPHELTFYSFRNDYAL